jgi:hypothetical protein
VALSATDGCKRGAREDTRMVAMAETQPARARFRRLTRLPTRVKTLGQREMSTAALLTTPKLGERFVEIPRLFCPEIL